MKICNRDNLSLENPLGRIMGRRASEWVLALLSLFFLGYSSASLAESTSGISAFKPGAPDSSIIPAEYGQVIYEYHGERAKRLYIIGLEHRDSLTRLNGASTAKVQAEIFKIGEWLVLNEGLELLLPEGFFSTKTGKGRAGNTRIGQGRPGTPLDMQDLEKRLADNRTYVNAEMLLKGNYGLRTRQIEDKPLYDAVYDSLCRLSANGPASCDLSEIEYLQERRLAAMLQKIPGIVAEEIQENSIRNRLALFTIGINHVSKIIKYLDAGRIEIPYPSSTANPGKDFKAPLNLSMEQFGVIVVIPKRLAENQEILRMTRLDRIIKPLR